MSSEGLQLAITIFWRLIIFFFWVVEPILSPLSDFYIYTILIIVKVLHKLYACKQFFSSFLFPELFILFSSDGFQFDQFVLELFGLEFPLG